MKFVAKASILLAVMMFTAGLGLAADTAPVPAARPNRPTAPAVEKSADLQKLIDQFNSTRDQILAERQALYEQLKNATAEQKKEILEKNQAEQKDRIEAQRALGKQIRDEMRKIRRNGPGR